LLPYGFDDIRVMSQGSAPLAGGALVSYIDVQYTNNAGNGLESDALPTGAPSAASMPVRLAHVSGWNPADGQSWSITMELDAPLGGGELTVSPANGPFVRGQPLAPALIMPAGTQVASIAGSVNGWDMPWIFQGCYPSYFPSASRVVYLCQDFNWSLMAGVNHVEFRVTKADGTTMVRAVDWEILE
jgi:hypothetical protein